MPPCRLINGLVRDGRRAPSSIFHLFNELRFRRASQDTKKARGARTETTNKLEKTTSRHAASALRAPSVDVCRLRARIRLVPPGCTPSRRLRGARALMNADEAPESTGGRNEARESLASFQFLHLPRARREAASGPIKKRRLLMRRMINFSRFASFRLLKLFTSIERDWREDLGEGGAPPIDTRARNEISRASRNGPFYGRPRRPRKKWPDRCTAAARGQFVLAPFSLWDRLPVFNCASAPRICLFALVPRSGGPFNSKLEIYETVCHESDSSVICPPDN